MDEQSLGSDGQVSGVPLKAMPATGLFIVTSDPRTSPRPAEAVRIAAGVNPWKKGSIDIYLHGPAILALGEDTGELIDEELFTQYWPVFQENGGNLYIQKDSPFAKQAVKACTPIEISELARVALDSQWVNCF